MKRYQTAFLCVAIVAIIGILTWSRTRDISGIWIYESYAGVTYVISAEGEPPAQIDSSGNIFRGKFVRSGLRSKEPRWDLKIRIPDGQDPRRFAPSVDQLRRILTSNGLTLDGVEDTYLVQRYPPIQKQK
jgi:hypothetical protein